MAGTVATRLAPAMACVSDEPRGVAPRKCLNGEDVADGRAVAPDRVGRRRLPSVTPPLTWAKGGATPVGSAGLDPAHLRVGGHP